MNNNQVGSFKIWILQAGVYETMRVAKSSTVKKTLRLDKSKK